jgi:hypothetical protein
VRQLKYDNLYGVYHLLADRGRPADDVKLVSSAVATLPVVTRTERRSSITTGIVERVEVPIEVHSQENVSAVSSSQTLSPTLLKQLRIINELKMSEVRNFCLHSR